MRLLISTLADMSISQWVELGISGVVLVAIGVAMYLMYLMFKQHNKELDQRNEELNKREQSLAEQAEQNRDSFQHLIDSLTDVAQHPAIRKYTPEDDKRNVEFQDFLSTEVKTIHDKTYSSRAFFCMYHNGAHSLNNISFFKFSLIAEA